MLLLHRFAASGHERSRAMVVVVVLLLLVSIRPHWAMKTSNNVERRFSLFRKNKTTAEACPIGWHPLSTSSSKCFLLENTSSTSWEESEMWCKDRHRRAHLASVSSDLELGFVQNMCQSSAGCWLGGQLIPPKRLRWTDCRPWNQSNPHLRPTFTNGNSQKQCVLVTQISGLVLESCTSARPYVCLLAKDEFCKQEANRKEYLVILISVSCVIFITAAVIVTWLLVFRKNKGTSPEAATSMVPLSSFRMFTVEELRFATGNFSRENRLRQESSFKGVLTDGSLVTVKKLERASFQTRSEFLAEMARIARWRHPSIVALTGCCYEHGSRYIVYEYVTNGPLDDWLHDPVRRRTLDWRTRMRIAITAAEGIAYLHDQVKPHVIHRDVRSSSLLLDESFGARLMGVGLANLVPWVASYERTVVAGTHGYLAPEFVYRNELTTKSDAYSFGVLLLELMSGRKPAMPVDVVNWQTIFEWATPLVQAQRFNELMDSSLATIPVASEIQKLVDLVYSCTQHVPSLRPRMSHVVHQLQQVDVEAVHDRRAEEPAPFFASHNEPARIPVQSEIIESSD